MNKLKLFLLYSIPFFVIVMIWLYYPVWIYYKYPFGEIVNGKGFIDELGPFGDVYGALNTLFSGLAFAGLIISIRLQSKELSETREELKEQSEQFRRQTEGLVKQTFESTFFKLLKMYGDAVGQIKIESQSATPGMYGRQTQVMVGVSAITFFNEKQSDSFLWLAKKENFSSLKYDERMESAINAKNNAGTLYSYVRTLERILYFVEKSALTKKDKTFYLSIFSAQLSSSEMLFIFLYGIHGKSGVKSLIENVGLLSNFDLGLKDELDFNHFIRYKITAYGDFVGNYWDRFIHCIIEPGSGISLEEVNAGGRKLYNPKRIKDFKAIVKDSPNIELRLPHKNN